MQGDDRSDTAEDGADDVGGGWDNRVTRVGRWVERTPRFPDREAQLRGAFLRHEVLYGLVDGGPAYVESGLVGVVARLAPTESAGST